MRTTAPSGAELLCQGLAAAGITHVFGLPGTQTVAVHEALRRSGLRTVLATHELAACFMANGYYRATGRVAALLTIPGPGFAYALAGLAEASHDSAALLHLTVLPPDEGRRFPFQVLDQRAMAAPVVKAVLDLRRAGELPGGVGAAVALALAGEPGPVLLQVAPALLVHAGGPTSLAAPPAGVPPLPPDCAQLDTVAALVAAAERPVLLLGQGAAGAAPEVRGLAEALGAPVVTTTSGRGLLPEDHPLAMGFDLAQGGAGAINELFRSSDCILALGCKLGGGLFALDLPADRLVHVDASGAVLGANYPARATATCSVEAMLAHLAEVSPALRARWAPAEVETWRVRLRAQRGGAGPEPRVHGVTPRTAAGLFAAFDRALPRDAVVVADSGLHQDLVRRHHDVLAPRGLIVPTDFQSMGFGLPAAIGAKLAAPQRPVVAVLGDGGFAMSGLELLTAVRERLPIPVVVFNDGRLNRIRLQQLATHGRTESVDVLNPDFAAFADAVGAGHERVDGDAEGTLRRALGAGRPTIVEVLLGDSGAIHASRAAGLARGAARRALGGRLAEWLRRRTHGR